MSELFVSTPPPDSSLDAFPAPVVRTAGDKLLVLTQVQGKSATHEMLWWGP